MILLQILTILVGRLLCLTVRERYQTSKNYKLNKRSIKQSEQEPRHETLPPFAHKHTVLYLAMLVLLPKLNLFSIIVPRFRCKLKHISVSLLYRHQRSDYDCLYLPSCLDYCITCPFSFTPLHPELSVVHHYTMQDLLVAVGLLLNNKPFKGAELLTPRNTPNKAKL